MEESQQRAPVQRAGRPRLLRLRVHQLSGGAPGAGGGAPAPGRRAALRLLPAAGGPRGGPRREAGQRPDQPAHRER